MRSCIYFFKEGVQFKFSSRARAASWIKKVIRSEGGTCGEISFVFCTDPYLLKLNQRFLKHDYFTDVVTFDNTNGTVISGEVYISIDRVRDNAEKLNIPFHLELNRVMVHGVLHLLGYVDSTERAKATMRSKEDSYLSLLPSST